MSIIDERKTQQIIGPCKEMIPPGTTNYLYDVTYKNGKIGEIEIGTDGFIQIRIKTPRGYAWANIYNKLTFTLGDELPK